MLQFTLPGGKVVQRVFAGFIATEEDLRKFVAEMKSELSENHRPILCEMWEYIPQERRTLKDMDTQTKKVR